MNLMHRNARIVATLGPSCQDDATLQKLIEAGIDVARLNFSHGTYPEHAARIAQIRRLSSQLGKPITILQDLQGPKMRVGIIPDGPIQLTAGQTVILTSKAIPASPADQTGPIHIPFDFPEFNQSVHAGSHVLLDDGHLELKVIAIEEECIQAKVLLGGPLSSHKGVNLPGSDLAIPGFTAKDREDLAFGLDQGVDAVAISFVRSANDIEIVREAIRAMKPERASTPIIAKLERPEALENLEAIMRVTDGVMVARGDLGVEMPPATVPIAQKKIIQTANRYAKIVITATQMLDSMINNPRPTRAEASDVANAVFDGTDAVMLSGETASGKYPVEAVEMMARIVSETEAHSLNPLTPGHRAAGPLSVAETICESMAHAAKDLKMGAIAVFTETATTARMLSKYRPAADIYAFSSSETVRNRMNALWGTTPLMCPPKLSVERMAQFAEEELRRLNVLSPGDIFGLVAGTQN